MLKIYRVFDSHGNIILHDFIEFNYGKFSTGINGYGDITINPLDKNKSSRKISYDYVTDKDYIEFTRKNAKLRDGFITNSRGVFYFPLERDRLEKIERDIDKNPENYKSHKLNEDGILLFTDFIELKYINDGLVERIFGRYPDTGMYLVKPGATITMSTCVSPKTTETYEVLQSKNLAKQLVLTKLNRKIY